MTARLSLPKRLISERFLPLFILLLGGLLRLVALGTVPEGMHQDEAIVVWNAFAVFREGMDSAGHRFPVYMADWGDGHSPMYSWLLMPFFLLTGGHIAPPFLSRLPQALVSILTLWTVYRLLKELFHPKAGLWGLFLLAICPWHIMMSRWGLDVNLAPGFLMFGLYFFVRGLERPVLLLLSALFYGLSLYTYALVWPVVPLILALQIAYCLIHKKIRIDRWSLLASLLLFFVALPLMLFVLVNSDVLPEIALPFMTIPKMSGYRGSSIAHTIPQMWANLRGALSILWHQKGGTPYAILLPWGLFYDIGRVFIVIGTVLLLIRLCACFRNRSFSKEYFLFAQLAGGGLSCLLVNASPHQINALYIPLVLSQAYGVWAVTDFLCRKKKSLGLLASSLCISVYLICLALFQRDYYTSYRQLVGAYFAKGLQECVDYAWAQCKENDIKTITVERGAQWPRLLLYTETLPSEYLSTIVYDYDVYPAPVSFETKGIRINTRIDYNAISQKSVYILYFTDVPVFEPDFELTQFADWYVAVPRHPDA